MELFEFSEYSSACYDRRHCLLHKYILNLTNNTGEQGNIMQKLFRDILKDESGATAIQYSLIATLVSVAGIAALTVALR